MTGDSKHIQARAPVCADRSAGGENWFIILGARMLIGIFFAIIIFWLLGVMMAYTLGGLIHLLLLLAAIVLFIEFLERRKVF